MRICLDEVVLRRLEPNDINDLYQYRNDWEVIRTLGGFSAGYSRQDLKEWMEYHRNCRDEIIWTVAEQETDRCLGHVGLYNIDHRVRKAEFAIMIGDRKWWGRGLGRKVTQAVVDYGFCHLNLHRVYLSVLQNNERAISLYHSLGFRKEGVLRHDQFRDGSYLDTVLLGIHEEEWCQG
jgi:RimJ/RimL family protein N-acetyltransferase